MTRSLRILLVGGGIGGLSAAIALRRRGFSVDLVERDPDWSVYGVGIIQQSNVVRAMAALEILDDYIDAGCGFDSVDVFAPDGRHVATVPSPRLVPSYPANVGIGRPALHAVLCGRASSLGTTVRLGVTMVSFEDDGDGVDVVFSDRTAGRYDVVIGADGLYSTTRSMLFPDAPTPHFAGQGVWRYNFPRPSDLSSLHVYEGATGIGLVPLSDDTMYMYVTSAEAGNPRYPVAGIAGVMRGKLGNAPPAIHALADLIVDDAAVVYRPLETIFVEGPWSRGRVGLLGDAVHSSTPHLGQGAGMAIEDAIVLAEELDRAATPQGAFAAYRERRLERCRYIVDASLAICQGQIGTGSRIDQAQATRAMFEMVAQPI